MRKNISRLNPHTGLLECLGRADRQIKAPGGQRVELGEIEAALDLALKTTKVAEQGNVGVVFVDTDKVGF